MPRSLYQDLPGQIGSLPESDGGDSLSEPTRGGSRGHAAIRHRQSESGSVGTHWIYIDPDSHLHCLLGRDSVMVNSFHHQAVKDPGTGVRVVARAADGVVEAWEWQHSGSSRRSSNICVQFHPEIFVKSGDTTFLPLFQDLIDRAR